jgi:hypothetical protein
MQKGRPTGTALRNSTLGIILGRMLVEDREDLLERGRLVSLFHRRQFAREARGGRFEDLAFGIGLFGLIIGAEQVAGHFGDRNQIARIDLRFVFLGAARPHGALDLGLAGQRIERFAQGLVRRQLAHADRFDLVGRHAQGHAFLFKAQHIEFQSHPGDFLLLQFDHPANAVLGINNVVTNIEGVRLGHHVTSFHSRDRRWLHRNAGK